VSAFVPLPYTIYRLTHFRSRYLGQVHKHGILSVSSTGLVEKLKRNVQKVYPASVPHSVICFSILQEH